MVRHSWTPTKRLILAIQEMNWTDATIWINMQMTAHSRLVQEISMRHEYDLFERFPDGSSLWRASTKGLENTRYHLHDLAKHSSNEFYAINVVSGKVVFPGFHSSGFEIPAKIGRRSRAAAA
jgi:hypothetical protein